jgi:putative endonuclease
MSKLLKPAPWYVYLLRCRDGSLYCGITTDIPRRVLQHNSGKGAKYVVPARRPVECVWKRRAADHSQALSLEYGLKRIGAPLKAALVDRQAKLTIRRSGEWEISIRTAPRNR